MICQCKLIFFDSFIILALIALGDCQWPNHQLSWVAVLRRPLTTPAGLIMTHTQFYTYQAGH